MSASAPLRTAQPSRGTGPARPPLRLVVTGPLTGARAPFVVLVVTILAGGLIALLLLHTMAAQDAFRLQALQHQQATLADQVQQLELLEQERADPATLAARARALGMVPTESLAFVRVGRHHGKSRIVGIAKAAAAPAPPAPAATASPAADHSEKKASSKPRRGTRDRQR